MNAVTKSLIYAFLGALVLIVIFAWQSPKEDEPQAAEEFRFEADRPDLLGQSVRYNQLNPDGSLHYRLDAAEIRQFQEQEKTALTTPHLHLRSPTQPPWDIEAETGVISRTESPAGTPEDLVLLRRDVRMVQETDANGTITIRSEMFYLYPSRQYATTNEDVIIDTEVGRTQAAGMTANMDTGVLTLTSSETQRVHTIVLPEQFKKTRT